MGKGRKKKHQQTSIYKKIKIIEKLQSQQESATDLKTRVDQQDKLIASLKAKVKTYELKINRLLKNQ